jgi:Family of unknown function (DUF6085)
MPPIRDVVGYCPMGCGPHLHVMSGGMIMCLAPKCPDPGSVTKILSDPETGHVVEVTDNGYTVKHPLRERVDDLFSCGTALAMGAEVLPPGRWRPEARDDGTLFFKRIDPPA